MNRRPNSRLAVALALAGVACFGVTSCGSERAGSTASEAASPSGTAKSQATCPAGDAPVAWLRLSGGFAGGRDRSGPPWVAVYPDGRVVLNGGPTMRLSDDELQAFLTSVSSDLADQPKAASPSGYAVADARTATLFVQTCGAGAEARTVTATGLDAVPDAFSPELVDAYTAFATLAHQVTNPSGSTAAASS